MIQRFFQHNRAAKLGSFLLAVALWLYAISGATRVGLLPGTIPLQVKNVPDQLVATASVDSVRVRLAADPSVWRQLAPTSVSATIDLSGQSTGLIAVPVQLLVSVANVQVIEAIPRTVEVQIEHRASRQKPVEIKTEGEPAGGLFASPATTEPDTVTVTGGDNALSRLDHVTAVVDISGATSDRDETVPIQALDASGHAIAGLTLTPTTVHVHQPLTKLAATKTVGVRVVTTGTPPKGIIVTPVTTQPATITLAGSAALLSGLATVATKPIDISAVSHPQSVPATLDLPAGATLIGNSAIVVTFELSDQDATAVVNPALIFTGLASGRHVSSADPATPTVVLRGSSSRLASLGRDDVSLTLDLTGQPTAGSVSVPVSAAQLHLPDGVSLQQLITTAITVTLQ